MPSSLPADDAEELRFVDSRIEAGGAGGAKAGSFLLAPGEAIEGRFNGRPIAELSLKPAAAQLKAGFEGPLVRLEAAAEGLAEGIELVFEDGALDAIASDNATNQTFLMAGLQGREYGVFFPRLA